MKCDEENDAWHGDDRMTTLPAYKVDVSILPFVGIVAALWGLSPHLSQLMHRGEKKEEEGRESERLREGKKNGSCPD